MLMVWFNVCGEGLTILVVLEYRTLDAKRYIKEASPIARACDN